MVALLSTSTPTQPRTSNFAKFYLSEPAPNIDPLKAAVIITVDFSRILVAGYGAFQLKLVQRVVVVNASGTFADWRVNCGADLAHGVEHHECA